MSSAKDIMQIVCRQLENNFSLSSSERDILMSSTDINLSTGGGGALIKTIKALSKSSNKYFQNISVETFNIFHSVQNTIFLYWLSRELFLENQTTLAGKVYYLNKMLNCVELFYEVKLPDIWICDHPLGSVMGRAEYSDYFSFIQGCTVGNNHGAYPVIGKYVSMMSNSKILGNSIIGDHCVIAANTYVKDANIPAHSLVFGQSPNLIIKPYRNVEDSWI